MQRASWFSMLYPACEVVVCQGTMIDEARVTHSSSLCTRPTYIPGFASKPDVTLRQGRMNSAGQRLAACVSTRKPSGTACCTTVVRSVSVNGFGSYSSALISKETCGTCLSLKPLHFNIAA
ncbi:unnamed protein product [Polarella glacialis]|uniref:Uncharacterized protein n=1 Tax=Polarella glacialis TaxID=89957 RepID=A0A813GZR9_POLGL|nr:unnamed protein product [Polarella glacialis]CAE8672760.1 unnamed protein product [Polarella glacialis]